MGGGDGGSGSGGAERPGGSADQPSTHFEPPDPDYEFLGAFDLSEMTVSDPAVAASLGSSDDGGGSHKESGSGRSALSIVLSGASSYDSPARPNARCRLQWQSVALKETWLKSLRDAVVVAQAQAFPAMEAPYRPEAADELKVSAPAGVTHRSAADILAELGADPALLTTLGAASGAKLDAAAIANLGDALTPRASGDGESFPALQKGDSGRASSPSGPRRGLNLSALKQKHRGRSGTEDILDISPLSPPSSPRSERREPLARVTSFGSGIRRAVSGKKKKGSKVELTLSQPTGFQHVVAGSPSSAATSGVSDDEGGTHISDEPSIGSASIRSTESADSRT